MGQMQLQFVLYLCLFLSILPIGTQRERDRGRGGSARVCFNMWWGHRHKEEREGGSHLSRKIVGKNFFAILILVVFV